jgi:hypothetical protein
MQYLYHLANASLTLRFIQFLRSNPSLPIKFVTVISQVDGWVVMIKMNSPLHPQTDRDFRAFLNELGIIYSPSALITMALISLEAGQSVVDVMRRYQVAVVSHGSPQCEDIEAFRQYFIHGLGYCPQNLA